MNEKKHNFQFYSYGEHCKVYLSLLDYLPVFACLKPSTWLNPSQARALYLNERYCIFTATTVCSPKNVFKNIRIL